MKKVISISIFVILFSALVISLVNYYLFNKRIDNIEQAVQNKLINIDKLKYDIETIEDLSNKLRNINDELERIKEEKINYIEYLYDIGIVANDFLVYSKSVYDIANEFLYEVLESGIKTVSIKEITEIENELDEKDKEILELLNRKEELSIEYEELMSNYDDIINECNELKETLFILTSQN